MNDSEETQEIKTFHLYTYRQGLQALPNCNCFFDQSTLFAILSQNF